MKPIVSEEERKLVGYLTKKKKASGKCNVYFNKKSKSGSVKYFNGKFYSKKNKTTFTYRSSYELKFFLDLESNKKVNSYISEAMYIPYIDSTGVQRTYIPDLLVLYMDGTMEVLEIKPKAMVKDADVQKKAAACRNYLLKNYKDEKIRYKFITEKDLFKNTAEYTTFLKENKGKDFSK
jgi:phosphopantothenoylcysteine synthetase/decarboxylase